MKIINICAYKCKKIFNFNYKILIIVIIFFLGILLLSKKYFLKSKTIIPFDYEDNCTDNNKLNEKSNIILDKYNNKKLICLTFDDGPSEYTKLLIDGLKERNVNVTFFVLGKKISKYPQYLKEAYKNGNEIGIHGYSHKLFTRLKNEKILDEIDITNKEIYNLTGQIPSLIRVPYGSLSSRVKKVLNSVNLQSILWTIDSKDWKYLNSQKDYNYVLKKIKGNDIILMHDTYKPSVLAALNLIDELKNEGYMFITVSEYIKCWCN